MRALLLSAAAVLAGPALAADWTVSPFAAQFDNLSFSAGGLASGALFAPDAPKGVGAPQQWATGLADLNFKLQRDYDSGLSLSLKSTLEVLRDRLSYDNYGGALFAKVYGQAQTGLGTIEVGMNDGVASQMAVIGPMVDAITSIDNPSATFFIDPSTHRSFQEAFDLSTAQNASLNYAKISYTTPRLFGVQFGVSYTPGENREVVPFLNNGPHAANRQKSIWETAASYSSDFEDFSLGFYGAASFAHGDGKAPGDAGLTDWGVGAEIDVPLNEALKLAFGGGYRHANDFGFDLYSVSTAAGSESIHLSSALTWNDWSFGGEYGRGTASDGATVIGVKAYEVSLGYQINTNLQATVGWQEMVYDRNLATWYDGSQRIRLDAGFLHLKFKV